MIRKHGDKFAKALAGLAAIYGETLSRDRVEGYYLALEDLRLMDVLTAIGRCSKTCRRFPAPIELREAATGSPDERALHAWGIALDAYDRLGSYASPDFDDSRLAVALETCGGWQAFYNQKREFLRRDFLMAYKALLRSAAPPRTLLHGLPGGPGRVVVEDHDPLYLPSGEQPPKRMDDVSPELATGIRRRMLRDVSRPKETE